MQNIPEKTIQKQYIKHSYHKIFMAIFISLSYVRAFFQTWKITFTAG